MTNPYHVARPLLFRLPPETAHRLVHAGLRGLQRTPLRNPVAKHYTVDDPRLSTTVLGQPFPNPVGVAAGFDKNAEIPRALAALGFGFVEVGGVTATPQEGNERPRMFRLPADEAIINRMGLNNDGAAVIGDRLARQETRIPVGVNIAKTEDVAPENAPADYRKTYEQVTAADFFVVNISCPNSQGFEELQNRETLASIFNELVGAGANPLLVKLSPDLPEPAIDDAIDLVDEFDLDGIVATNTTTDRPESLQSSNATQQGGLSGAPLEGRATAMVRYVARRTDVPIIGVGGVATAQDAYEKIKAGASLVQLYTALVYRGPGVARDINEGLVALLEEDGFETVEDAVGTEV